DDSGVETSGRRGNVKGSVVDRGSAKAASRKRNNTVDQSRSNSTQAAALGPPRSAPSYPAVQEVPNDNFFPRVPRALVIGLPIGLHILKEALESRHQHQILQAHEQELPRRLIRPAKEDVAVISLVQEAMVHLMQQGKSSTAKPAQTTRSFTGHRVPPGVRQKRGMTTAMANLC